MQNNSISKLLGIKGVMVKNVSESDISVKVYITTKVSTNTCPTCNNSTSRVHDYRNQTIKDIPFMGKKLILILKKRRYTCTCGKRFYEKYDFLPKYRRMSNRLYAYICSEMRKSIPMSYIARDLGISISTVARIFDYVQYTQPYALPAVLSIDEFRGNAETGKYQCILVDAKKKRVIDILEDRRKQVLTSYFASFSKYERSKVKFFVCDMWRQYVDIARTFLPNAKIIIDKYHFIRQVTWAIENVRKRVQKSMPDNLRRYFKRSRTLILKRFHNLSNQQREYLESMLLYNDDLRTAYWLKEEFYKICHMQKYSEQREAFASWIKYAESLQIKEFKACIGAFRTWYKQILNAFKYGYTNGPIEGFNNKIKVLKRVSYGVRNFERFRNRILHICS